MDHILQVLHVKGRATFPELVAAVRTDPTDSLAGLVAAGLIDQGRRQYRLAERARRRVDELYASEREQARGEIESAYKAFEPLNEEVKQAITDWQVRTIAGELCINDHTDHRYDDDVIDRLRDAHADAMAVLATLAVHLPRVAMYTIRLDSALTRVLDGDHSMIATPLEDSYHTVWFELHEDLLTLLGRSRRPRSS